MARRPAEVDAFVSTLPVYEAKRSNDFPAFLIVWCPREDCPGTKGNRPFLVAEREWMRPQRIERVGKDGRPIFITGRSCPYCFRSARLPTRSELLSSEGS